MGHIKIKKLSLRKKAEKKRKENKNLIDPIVVQKPEIKDTEILDDNQEKLDSNDYQFQAPYKGFDGAFKNRSNISDSSGPMIANIRKVNSDLF